jgi:hypothetical protein
MNAETLDALEESIAIWKARRAERFGSTKPGPSSCALCTLFIRADMGSSCIGCPVMNATGKIRCVGTPYGEASASYHKGTETEWQLAANAEIEFLESLLPE